MQVTRFALVAAVALAVSTASAKRVKKIPRPIISQLLIRAARGLLDWTVRDLAERAVEYAPLLPDWASDTTPWVSPGQTTISAATKS